MINNDPYFKWAWRNKKVDCVFSIVFFNSVGLIFFKSCKNLKKKDLTEFEQKIK